MEEPFSVRSFLLSELPAGSLNKPHNPSQGYLLPLQCRPNAFLMSRCQNKLDGTETSRKPE